ncbi:MAG: VCBS repeat-containing protein, partial [Phycisphaerales bacterium]|nr:VCBS repeat-containing protein [Phycisphaerales bacterium]
MRYDTLSGRYGTLWGVGLLLAAAGTAAADWVDFVDETALRLPVPPNSSSLSTNDPEEKDYAFGDVDQDGDIDLVCVRKQPFTSAGKKVNVLFMNEGPAEGHSVAGVLIDRTAQYASASDVSGDNGFLTPTNDRDVALADLDGDGWLDIITAPTLTDNQAKHLSHPRVYINLGEDGGGNWLGFRYEDARIPEIHPVAGPRFCAVTVGDIDNDGDLDLYFADYDSGQPQQIFDYDNRLLVNDGNGFFTDQTLSRLTTEMRNSAFGASCIIADMNGDGANDVVKQFAGHVAITYNNAGNPGVFNAYDVVANNASYFVNTGDLNGDGRIDLLISDDGTDRYMINTGNGGNGRANFAALSLPAGPSSGFGGNNYIADLNNDGFPDALTTPVDVDISGCGGAMRIYRNLGNTPNVTLSHPSTIGPPGQKDPPGVHDVAIFDINGDEWPDMVVGTCSGTKIWINVPPFGMQFTYPQGLPGFIPPGETAPVHVRLIGIGGQPLDDSAILHYAFNGGAFDTVAMTNLGDDEYEADLPAGACLDTVRFYVTAQIESGTTFADPTGAPVSSYIATFADGVEEIFSDDMENDVSGWSVESENLLAGEWEIADPNGTFNSGMLIAPEDDATQGDGVLAWVTQNGLPGGGSGDADVDGGPTRLLSPVFDLSDGDATISYRYWLASLSGVLDSLVVQVSNDGANWATVTSHGGTDEAWEEASFTVSAFVEPTATVRVRFVASDQPNDSFTEAGIDEFRVNRIACGQRPACVEDLTNDGAVGPDDLASLLAEWGTDPGGAPDFDGSGLVDAA